LSRENIIDAIRLELDRQKQTGKLMSRPHPEMPDMFFVEGALDIHALAEAIAHRHVR
jgi:hypothetical protein